MADLDMIYGLELTGDKELVSRMHAVNSALDATKKTFLSLKKEMTGGKLNAFQTNNISSEYEKAKIELIKLRQESVRLTNENKVQLRIIRERREQERLAKKEASQSVDTYKEMSKALTQARNQLKSLLLEGKGNSTLAQKLKQDVTELDNKLKQVDAQTGQFYRNVGNYPQNNGLIKLGADVNKLILGYVGLHAAMNLLSSTVSNVAELSDETANLEIELGKAKGGAQGLVDELSKIDTRTKTVDLVGMANIAVKAGVSEENLVDVTKAVDMIKTAFGKDFGDVETGTESLVKLINIFEGAGNVTGEHLLRMGNAIRTIANESVASVPYLNDFSGRLAGLKSMMDITLPATLGLASGFEQLKQPAEVASTALVKILPKIASNVEKYAKIVGKSKEEFSKILNESPEEAFLQVAEAIQKGKANVEDVAKAMADAELGSGRISTILSAAGGNVKLFREAIKSAKEAYEDTSNILDAFNAKNETFAAKLDKIKKKFADLANNKALQNAFTATSSAVLFLIQALTNIPMSVWITGVTLLTLAYWNNVKALLAVITQHAVFATRQIIGNALIATGTILINAQALALGTLRGAWMLLNSTILLISNVIPSLRTAWISLNLTLMSTPIGAVLAGVVALSVAVMEFGKKTENTGKAIRENSTIMKVNEQLTEKATESISGISAKMDRLTLIVKDNSISLETRKKALKQLIDISPEYLNGLNLENIATAQGTRILDNYKKKLFEVARAKAASALYEEKSKALLEAENSVSGLEKQKKEVDKYKNNPLDKRSWGEFAKGVGGLLGISEGDAEDKLLKTRETIKTLKSELDVLGDTVVKNAKKAEKAKIDVGLEDKNDLKIGYPKSTSSKYRGSSLLGIQKDFLKQQESIRDTALAINNKRFTEGEIKEKEYLENILKINTEFFNKKMSYLKGSNAQELKERAQADEAQSKLAKETRDKLLAIESTRVKNNFEKANATSKSQYDEVNDNPYSTEQEKIDAQKRFSEETLNNRRIFNIEMLGLEMKYKITSTEEEEKRASELVTLAKKTQNELLRIKSDELKKQSEEIRKNTEDEKNKLENRASEEKLKVLNVKKLNLYQKERKEAVINAELKRKLLEEDLKAIGQIIDKYQKKAETSKLTTEEIRMQNLLIKEQSDLKEQLFKAEIEETKIRRAEVGMPQDTKSALISGLKRSIRGKDGTGGISLGKDKDGNDVDGTEMLGEILGQGYDLAMQAMNNYFETERQNIERNKQLAYERIDNERKRNIMFAQSSDEVDQINREAERKKKEADKKAFEEKKKLKKQELQMNLANELSAIAVSAAQNKMNGITFGATGLAMYAMLSGMALARYAINLSNIEKQQFAKGGKFGIGGRLKGPSHHENGGLPVINPISGEVQAYLEGDEGIINKRSMSDKRKYTVSGTPSQIASRINALGGGIDWDGGAMISKFANGGAFLGSMVRPPVFADYYKDFGANERLQSIEGLLVETNETLLREVNRKTIVSSREISNTEKEYQRQTTIVNL